jgi:hypothetical protein
VAYSPAPEKKTFKNIKVIVSSGLLISVPEIGGSPGVR